MNSKIKVAPGGPYEVSGGVPLKEMAPVHTLNGEPIDWHALRDIDTGGADYRLCRCGRSKQRPFCDDACASPTFDGTETASRAPYRSRASESRRDAEVLTDDKPLCMKAGFCATRTTNVWILLQSKDQAEVKRMREMVWRCPSGRLNLFGPDGFPEEEPLAQEIAVVPGGPLWLRGGIALIAEDGQQWEPRNRMTLCRCGQSKNKPFCDATHASIHFDER